MIWTKAKIGTARALIGLCEVLDHLPGRAVHDEKGRGRGQYGCRIGVAALGFRLYDRVEP